MVTKNTHNKFSKIPTLAISEVWIRLVAKTIALGGVATGNIKAKEQDIVAGTIRNNGWILIAIANAPKIGSKISTVVTFEVSSVKKVTNKTFKYF